MRDRRCWINPNAFHEDDRPHGGRIRHLRHQRNEAHEMVLLRDVIRRAMWSLDNYEIEMILDRFNLYDMGMLDKPMNQELIAKHWQLPRERVRFILETALETMRQSIVASGLGKVDFV